MNTCPATSVTIPASVYYGYQFYSATPFTVANVFNPATAITVTKTIYAYGMNGGCRDTVLIRVNINSCPDIDKDNDGLPDYVESNIAVVFGDHDLDGVPNYRDTNYPGFVDYNSDGINDNFDPGADSDNDGIRNFLDVNFSGFVDTDNDGVNDAFDTDKDGIPDFLDIDSDNDGIPDNIEAQATSSYAFASGLDTDGDGLDNTWDNFPGIGGNGVTPLDTDADLIPDYLDSDADGDGLGDLIEGNDLNMNHLLDDNIALSGLDNDGDGLDNFFDSNNSSNEGTSLYMGPGGSTSGDATPGSITTVQHTNGSGCGFERDWRCASYILECLNIALKGNIIANISNLQWYNTCNQEVDHFVVERSVNGINYSPVTNVNGKKDSAKKDGKFTASDNIPTIHPNVIYYRLISYSTAGKSFYSPAIALKVPGDLTDNIRLLSNPVRNIIELVILSPDDADTEVRLFTTEGSRVMTIKDKINRGETKLRYTLPAGLHTGNYYLHVKVNNYLKVIKVNHQQ
jgi:hypothetical protein